MKARRTATILFALLTSFAFGQDWLDVDGVNIVDESGNPFILKGMGLGGWMLQEGYMLQTAEFANSQHKIRAAIEDLIGEADTDLFYDAWLDNHVQKVDIDSMASWGFNSIRLPIHYNLFTLPIEEEPTSGQHTWVERGFELTDNLIAWCKANNMYVVLDLHAAPGGQGYDEGISDYDPTKPSLWESQANKDKTVALWRRIAERYANEPAIAGYDLINEPNWDLPGGTDLRNLYVDITNAIREVDTDHIIFIEGNWFANDFTGLTPPWDSKLVYSPHKYWSTNGVSDMNFATSIRDAHNVPLYLGETGENSNVWFRDAIALFDELNIGWAWWPEKKVESISGLLSIKRTEDYNTLLEYWKGNGSRPTAEFAKTTLMQLTEDLKVANCKYQPDVVDAMFRQVNSSTTKPYTTNTIPGVIYSTDYDMGINGSAYFDKQDATYHVTTGNFTAWNNGWAYRNDGVDIEVTQDNVDTNGFNVGWIDKGEWMKYTVEVTTDGVYDIDVRVASGGGGGSFQFLLGDVPLSSPVQVPDTQGWQSWQTVTVSDVVLSTEDTQLTYYATSNGVNLGSFNFTRTGNSTDIPTSFVSLETIGTNEIEMILNKSLTSGSNIQTSGFSLTVDGASKSILQANFDPSNPRRISLVVDHEFKSSEEILLTFTGSHMASDGTSLSTFSSELVDNNIAVVFFAGDVIEAEDHFNAEGVEEEETTDIGGGLNVSHLDVGDYLDFMVEIPQTGLYQVTYRTASETEGGGIQLQQIVDGQIDRIYHTVLFDATGGWQEWTSKTHSVNMFEGTHQLRLYVIESLFNLNWFRIASPVLGSEELDFEIEVVPNPSKGQFSLTLSDGDELSKVKVIDLMGKSIFESETFEKNMSVDISANGKGIYLLQITNSSGIWLRKIAVD